MSVGYLHYVQLILKYTKIIHYYWVFIWGGGEYFKLGGAKNPLAIPIVTPICMLIAS